MDSYGDYYQDLVRAMAYGPSQGEYQHDALFGPLGRLEPGDVALSPNLQKKYPLGSQILVQPTKGDPFTARVADHSYFKPGEPTKDTIEFWNGQDLGHVRIGPVPQGTPDAGATPSALDRYGAMNAAAPTPSPGPVQSPASPDGMSATQFATKSWGPAAGALTASSLAAPGTTETVMGGLSSILGSLGKGMQQQGQQSSQQAMAMLKTSPNALSSLLQQLVNNPTMYLQQPYG